MAPKQRGVRAKSSKADRSDEIMESCGLELGSSDDDAPEVVTFEDSKAQALRSVKQALESARREKDLLKERRKKRQKLFQEQKKRKLLSVELLEEIDSLQKQSQRKAEATPQDEEQREEELEEMTETKQEKLEHSRKLKGNYKVTTVKPQALSSFQQKTAEDFLQSRLYGAGSRRATSSQLLSLQNKTARTKGAAVQFVKSQWAREQKSKAEKLKLRWIRKQIPSS
ncbi:nucleolar protein 7 isoform X1 [Phyllopteryx taeniolatus]|uniref:nucleolar protein 7 isoform X1 n=1 Tax=Phyllopteryx taeniolatus TaxID=161469 RepID=UPI002AD3FB17|nr:nucleolar protein 7 isoform X1 [Phyllopteryx taeniolatus]